VEAGISPAAISARFHGTVASIVREMCSRIRDEHNLNQVALSGGCFQNRLLLRLVVAELHGEGFKVLLHRRVPPNDGGIALGQVAVAAHRPAG
jgi:hydrogenase maturation protein HypF